MFIIIIIMYIQLERRDYRDVCTAAVAQQMRLPVPSPVLRMVTRMQAVDGSGFPIVNICKYTNMQCVCIYIYDIWYQHVRNKCFKWVTSPKWHVSVLVSLGWWATIVLSFGRFLHDDWDQNNGSCMTTLKLGVEWITTATQKKWPLKLDFGFYPLQNVKKPSRCSMVSAPSFRGVYGPGAWKT